MKLARLLIFEAAHLNLEATLAQAVLFRVILSAEHVIREDFPAPISGRKMRQSGEDAGR